MNATQTQNVVRRFRTIGNHHVLHRPSNTLSRWLESSLRIGSLPSTGVITRRRLPWFHEGNDTCDFQQGLPALRRRASNRSATRQTTGDILGTADSCGIRAAVSPNRSVRHLPAGQSLYPAKYRCRHCRYPDQNVITLEHQRFSAPDDPYHRGNVQPNPEPTSEDKLVSSSVRRVMV